MYKIFLDGEAWCAVSDNLINIQESICGFGESAIEALGELIINEKEAELDYRESVRRWVCNNCKLIFHRKWIGDHAPCPRCSCGGQYTIALASTLPKEAP